MKFVAILILAALLPVVGAGAFMAGQETAPTAAAPPPPPRQSVDTHGLLRYKLMDSQGDSGEIRIVCKAWTNRPDFDPYAPVTKDAIGFRVVTDCVTRPTRVGQGSPAVVPAMP